MEWLIRLYILCCSAVISLIVPRLVLSSFRWNDYLSIIELSAMFGVSAPPEITLAFVPTTIVAATFWTASFPFRLGGFLTVCYFKYWFTFFLMPTLLIPTSNISFDFLDLLLLNLGLIYEWDWLVRQGESPSGLSLLKSTEIWPLDVVPNGKLVLHSFLSLPLSKTKRAAVG